MTAWLVLALCAGLGVGQPTTDGQESVRIYVFTAQAAEGSSSDEAFKARLSAVRDLRDALRRKPGLSVVDDRTVADVVVEVTARDQQSLGDGGFGGARLTQLVNTTIRLNVTAGAHQTEMKGSASGTGARAAKDAADRLLKWIVRTREGR